MTTTIRQAEPSDAKFIAKVYVDSWCLAYRHIVPYEFLNQLTLTLCTSQWSDLIGDPQVDVLVAVENSQIIGVSSQSPSRDADATSSTAELQALYVDPPCWGAGAGSSLLKRVWAVAASQNYSTITLWVLEQNSLARTFYANNDFTHDGGTKIVQFGDELRALRYRRAVP